MDYRDELARTRDSRRKGEDHQAMEVMLFIRYEDDDFGGEVAPQSRLAKTWETEVWVPAVYEVCTACSGRGKYVNPSIDSHGITGEEMHELGDDFREDYMGGTYDVTCDRCDGRNVMLVADQSAMSEELREEWIERQEEEAADRADMEAERRMGA